MFDVNSTFLKISRKQGTRKDFHKIYDRRNYLKTAYLTTTKVMWRELASYSTTIYY